MKKLLSFLLLFCLLFQPCYAAEDKNMQKTANYLLKKIPKAEISSVGGDWVIMGLARSSCKLPKNYAKHYYKSVEKKLKETNGILHEKKYTEYSRIIVALSAIDKNPTDVAGYNLLLPLGDFERTIWQGLNGTIWALIALDTKNYEIPENKEAKTQATRELYVDEILKKQLEDGGWTLGSKTGKESADADLTAMALQALSKYKNQEKVQKAIDKAIICLSSMQEDDGGYSSWGTKNCESCAQVIVALCELGIDINDERFVKNGYNLLDNLLKFQQKDGSFVHIKDGKQGNNLLATEQGFYALVALNRKENGKNSLYSMEKELQNSR